MKKVKKLVSALMALAMMFSLLAVSASAAVPAMTVEDLAYMDTATASPAQKEAILDARRQIVFGSQAWTVNGAVSTLNEDGTVEPLPEFSDLWPDWDLDEICKREPDPFKLVGNTDSFTVRYCDTVWLVPQSNIVNAPNFYEFNANGKPVYAWAYSMNEGRQCNIGFENRDTGKQEGWWPGLEIDKEAVLNTERGVRYGVRASTVAAKGTNARMVVSETPNKLPIG